MMNYLTVLICTYDRAGLLLHTLGYLNAARRPDGWRVEVLVVVNACADDTLDRLARFRQEVLDSLPLAWIEEHTPGKPNALNWAITRTRRRSDLHGFVSIGHRLIRSAVSLPVVEHLYIRLLRCRVVYHPLASGFTGLVMLKPVALPLGKFPV